MRATLLAICVLAGACGNGDDDDGFLDPNATELTFETGEFEVPVGDSFTCFYTDKHAPRELSVHSATGTQGLGGHHIIAYYADEDRPVGHHPCTDEEMTNLHQLAGSAGDNGGEPVLGLPDDLALLVPEGKQFVLQAHYINTTDAPMRVTDSVTLLLMKPEDVRAYVNYFVTNDSSFEIPASSTYSHTTYCTTQRDLDVIMTLGHMHEDGRQYTLEVVDGANAVMDTLIDNVWQPSYTSHPPVTYYTADEPMHLPAGTRLRQTCEWDNSTANPVIFPREMCLSFMYYFPGDGDDIVCNMREE
jgi:hypothetical protein